MSVTQILATYGADASVIALVAIVAIKWSQITRNTDCIEKIHGKLDKMNDKLDGIKEKVDDTHGWVQGFKNGKRR